MKQTFEIMYNTILYEVSIEFNVSLRELIIFYVYNLEDACYIDIKEEWPELENDFKREIVKKISRFESLTDSKYFN